MRYFSPHLLDGSVTTAKLADDAVTVDKIANDSVGQLQLQSTAVIEAKMGNAAISRRTLKTADVSAAGSIAASATLNIALIHNAFWPMIHVEVPVEVLLAGHVTDAPGADNPRFALINTDGAEANTYDLDYRYVGA